VLFEAHGNSSEVLELVEEGRDEISKAVEEMKWWPVVLELMLH
jgi:hypothetical protein